MRVGVRVLGAGCSGKAGGCSLQSSGCRLAFCKRLRPQSAAECWEPRGGLGPVLPRGVLPEGAGISPGCNPQGSNRAGQPLCLLSEGQG